VSFSWELILHFSCSFGIQLFLILNDANFQFSFMPYRYKHNPQLGTWVNNQRTQYRAFQEEGTGPMTDERAKKLEDSGFVWHASKRRSHSSKKDATHPSPFRSSIVLVNNATHLSHVRSAKVARRKRKVSDVDYPSNFSELETDEDTAAALLLTQL